VNGLFDCTSTGYQFLNYGSNVFYQITSGNATTSELLYYSRGYCGDYFDGNVPSTNATACEFDFIGISVVDTAGLVVPNFGLTYNGVYRSTSMGNGQGYAADVGCAVVLYYVCPGTSAKIPVWENTNGTFVTVNVAGGSSMVYLNVSTSMPTGVPSDGLYAYSLVPGQIQCPTTVSLSNFVVKSSYCCGWGGLAATVTIA
jgi:hypothetical protein